MHSPGLWKALTLTLSLVLVAGVVAVSSRYDGRMEPMELEIALVIATMPLIANIAWVDMLVLLILPYAVLLKYFLTARGRAPLDRPGGAPSVTPLLDKALTGGACASILLVSSPRLLDLSAGLVERHSWLVRSPFLLSMPFYGLVILWLSLAITLVSQKRVTA
jgi:hypothetical protein